MVHAWPSRLGRVAVVEAPMSDRARRVRARRIATWALLSVAGLITALGLLLIVAAWTEDAKIDRHTGTTSAKVVSVTFQRTLVRFQTPDGAEHIPSVGVLYPEQLEEGQVVSVEYDQTNPELVRVAGRGVGITLLPVGSTVLITWAVAIPLVWWLRRRALRM
jgi:Protein of unknown function (DUF3592)